MTDQHKRVRYVIRSSGKQVEMSVGQYVSMALQNRAHDEGQMEYLESQVEGLRDLTIRLLEVVVPLLPVEEVTEILGTSAWFETDREVVEVE